jgi:hypothetical protein
MKKFRKILIVAAILGGIGGAFAFERPDLLGSKRFSCGDGVYPACLGYYQYVLVGNEMVLAPQGGYGSSWVCMYNPSYVCTYAYMYCGQWGPDDWRFMPCNKGNFCYFNPDYSCNPIPPLSSVSGVESVIKLNDSQKKQIEEATAEFLDK